MRLSVERMRVYDLAVRKLMGMVEEVCGREEIRVHHQQEQSYDFSSLFHQWAKVRN